MIKGVNRQVVEVNDTGSDYFEKIMFFVKPEYISVSEAKIRESAGKIAGSTSAPPPRRVQKGKFFEIAVIVLAVLSGSLSTLIIMNLLK